MSGHFYLTLSNYKILEFYDMLLLTLTHFGDKDL